MRSPASHAFRRFGYFLVALAVFPVVVGACGSESTGEPLADAAAIDAGAGDDATSVVDATPPPPPPVQDAGSPADAGAAPIRRACTSAFGTELSNDYGILDGRLVAIVPEGVTKCNGDRTHVHLQVLMAGSVYDVAVNTDGQTTEVQAPPVGGPFREGWRVRPRFDYATNLNVHSTAFRTTNATTIERRLANVDRIRVYGIGYGPDGAHLIHRNGNARDGALLLNPDGPTSPYLLFRFVDQTF
jgi:hypothetical protein